MFDVNIRLLLIPFIGLVIGISLGVLLLDGGGARTGGVDTPVQNGTVNTTNPTYFAVARRGTASLFFWGLQEGGVELPGGISTRLSTVAQAVNLLGEEQAVVGFLPLSALPRLFSTAPDARILPYAIDWPSDTFGFYAATNTNITEPSDLAGKRVAIPGNVPVVLESFAVLEREYGVDRADMELINRSVPALHSTSLWSSGDIDAAFLMDPELVDTPVQPVFQPLKEFESRFGAAPLPGVFVVPAPSYVERGESVMDAVNASIVAASRRPEEAVSYYAGIVGAPDPDIFGNVRTSLTYRNGHLLVPLTDARIRSMAYRVQLLTGENITDLPARVAGGPR